MSAPPSNFVRTSMLNESVARNTMDAFAGVVALGTIAQILPPIAALMSIIWLGVQIYDRFFGKGKAK